MKKTLGGDRLGAGKKMQVDLHGYERSTFDRSKTWRSTMAAGTLVPFLVEPILPGSTWDIDLNTDIMTHPTEGPLFGSMKVQLDIFIAPMRLYNSWLHNNRLGIGRNMSQIKLPLIELTATDTTGATDIDNAQINPSACIRYLGIKGVGNRAGQTGTITREFNGIPYLALMEIYKNYYANKQEEIGACLHTPAVALVETITQLSAGGIVIAEGLNTTNAPITVADGLTIAYTGAMPIPDQIMIEVEGQGLLELESVFNGNFTTASPWTGGYNGNRGTNIVITGWRYRDVTDANNGKPAVVTFPLENIDKMKDEILKTDGNVPFIITDSLLTPYTWINQVVGGIPSALSSQELLLLKTHQSDMYNNWLSTEWLDGVGGINEITAVDTSGGSFEINVLLLSRKVFDFLNRIAVTGGSYDDYLDAAYTEERRWQAQSPAYLGGLIKELVFQEVVSNTATEGKPQGNLAGKGVLTKKHKGGHVVVKCDEPAYVIGLISITPRVDYSQGNAWHIHNKTMGDWHVPGLDGLGFQESINEQRAWWDTTWDGTKWVQTSAGKVPAWLNYMTAVNETYGNFAIADNEMFMTLNRRYEQDGEGGIKDLTTYIDPSKFNFIFAETQLDAQNYWAQIAVNMQARQKMSAKQMPNL